MNTNFFDAVSRMNMPGTWNLTIHTDEQGNFTVSALVSPQHAGEKALNAIPPLLLKGSAQELDESFFEAISTPLQQTAELYVSTEAYLKELERARLASKQEQDKKAKQIKEKPASSGDNDNDDAEVLDEEESKQGKEEKKKAYCEAMKHVAELDSLTKYEEALALLPSPEAYPDKEAELQKRKADLERKREQKKRLLF